MLIQVFQARIKDIAPGEDGKKDRADVQLKIGQLEAKIIADQMAMEVFKGININNPELHAPVEE